MTEYRYRADELLVHADDCVLIREELAGEGYRPGGGFGSWRRFVARAARLEVSDLLAALRTRYGAELRISPHYTFTPARLPWSVSPLWPRETDKSYPVPKVEPSGVRVGVIDTGIVVDSAGEPHPYLKNRVSFRPDDVDQILPGGHVGSDGHGSFVSGVILHEAPAVEVVMKGVLDKSTDDIEDLAVAKAISDLHDEGVRLINLSFSGSTSETEPPPQILEALGDLREGTVVVAAAGNSGLPRMVYPAAITILHGPRIIAVGAAADDGRAPEEGRPPIAGFSGYGQWVTCFASGTEIVGPYFAAGTPAADWPWVAGDGTSFAAAVVTGRIAANMANGYSAVEAAHALLDEAATPTVQMWDVNGSHDKPYVPQLG